MYVKNTLLKMEEIYALYYDLSIGDVVGISPSMHYLFLQVFAVRFMLRRSKDSENLSDNKMYYNYNNNIEYVDSTIKYIRF